MRSSVVFFFVLLSAQTNLFACEDWVAKVVSVNGLVEIGNGSQRYIAQVDGLICPGQAILVAENSRAAIYLSNNSFVRLDQSTVLAFPEKQTQQGFLVRLNKGVSHFISRIKQRFVVDAPYVNAAVDGTEFLVSATDTDNSVSVIEGQVTASNQAGEQAVTMGQRLVVNNEKSSFRLTDISAGNVIDWAIYYSPLPTLQELKAADSSAVLGIAIDNIKQQRPDLALQALEKVDPVTSSVSVAKAAILLSVGQSEQARSALGNIQSAQSLALNSVIYSTRNNAEQALTFAQKAQQKDPHSLSALLALSYAHQASLNLAAALDAARQATALNDSNPIAWARVSELELATGNMRQANKAIQHAQAQGEDIPYITVQAGFIQLFRIKLSSAQKLFENAIKQDSENPQAHLGLALTLLRDGKLEQGRKQLEYATSLDPARSVVRSYLGRAYFEEKRDGEAATQWELAKQLDPSDPTPYFYEGVRKLFANNPIGAIEELETSRKLNNERALYRSETLLQSDAASRSAILARAYDEVGYDQGVLLAAWDALRSDPTSSEGHRLLADKYRGNSRYEAARASELLQSQLWQPLSAYPLQPQLSETGISVVEGAGPQNPGFNEYHSLFTQNGVYGAVNGYGGSDGTWGDDLVGSFLAGPVAVSLGQYHFETDGWRENAGQEQDIYNGFVQWQIGSNTSIQYEIRKLNWIQGNLAPDWTVSSEITGEIDEQRSTNRIGIKHQVSANNSFIVSAINQDVDVNQSSNSIESDAIGSSSDVVNTIEIQNVISGESYNLVSGVGYTKQNRDADAFVFGEIGDLLPNQPDFSNYLDGDERYGFHNAYIYYTHIWKQSLQLVMGMAYDDFDAEFDGVSTVTTPVFLPFPPFGFVSDTVYSEYHDDFERNQFSPKFGMLYQLNPDSSVRFSLFRALSRAAAANQTIEPISMVGFSQLNEDPDFSDGKNIVFAYDSKNDMTAYGFTLMRRDVDFIYWSGQNVFERAAYMDDVYEVYFNLFYREMYAVSISLHNEKRDYNGFDQEHINVIDESEVYGVPIAISFFDSSGWEFEVEQSYYSHRITYLSVLQEEESASSWVTSVNTKKCLLSGSVCFEAGINNLLDSQKEVSNFNNTITAFYPSRFIYALINLNI